MLKRTLTIAGLLVLVAFCLLELVLHRQSNLFREYTVAFLSLQWMLLASFALWSGMFLWLAFGRKDWPLIGLLLIALAWYFIGPLERPGTAILVLVFGVTLGKGASFALKSGTQKAENRNFLMGLVALLALASWWHLDMSNNYYRGPRWMGLWDNPNTYGMLMGVGVALAIGLLAARRKAKGERLKGRVSADGADWRRFISGSFLRKSAESADNNTVRATRSMALWIFLWLAVFMLGVGLVMSYSRGAWLGTAIGLLYLAWCYGKLKWRYVLLSFVFLVLSVGLFWSRTPDSAPWYVKRADLGRPSAQNRATAWRAGLEIMRDYPLGVGWNQAVKIYGEKYHPPEGGPAAITTNDYLMLGTELGIPALLCFVAYVGLCYRKSPRMHLAMNPNMEERDTSPRPSPHLTPPPLSNAEREKRSSTATEAMSLDTCHASLRAACLGGALVFVVTFWFDGGLFKLPTAALFWVLLELGAHPGRQKMDDRSKTA